MFGYASVCIMFNQVTLQIASLTKRNTNLELSCFLLFCSSTIITESPSWAVRKGKNKTHEQPPSNV